MIGGLLMAMVSQVDLFNDHDSRHIRASEYIEHILTTKHDNSLIQQIWIHRCIPNNCSSGNKSNLQIKGLIFFNVAMRLQRFNSSISSFRQLSSVIFFVFGFAAIAPSCHLIFKSWTEERITMIVQDMVITCLIFFLATTVYCARFPERLFPGKFDYFGHSHSLFHLLVLVATLHHTVALVNIAKTSKYKENSSWWWSNLSICILEICWRIYPSFSNILWNMNDVSILFVPHISH